VAGPVYLDTSALIRRAEASLPSPTQRDTHAGAPVASLLAAPSVEVATCEIGLLEFHDVVTSMWRDTDASRQDHDEAWADTAVSVVMADIANARLAVRPVAPRTYEQAMSLVTMATRMHGRKFRVWDAVHLVTATAWATELGEPVELWTTDDDFDGFLDLYPHFKSSVVVRNLDH
jgi:hypothetical protein